MLCTVPINDGFSLLAIDEPELNLHAAWQKCVARWIQVSNNFKQCFISTHSPDFLDKFTEGFRQGGIGVYVFGGEDKKVKKVMYSDVESELEGWQLGDLYRSGEPLLGGWPW